MILLCNQVLSSAKSILPFLEYAASSKKSLLIVANDVSNEALQTLVLNKSKGVISVCAVKAPEFGNARAQALDDLAQVVGGIVLTGDEKIEKTDDLSAYLGNADKAIIDKYGTLLIGTKGDRSSVEEKIKNLTNELESPGLHDSEHGLLQRRIRRLSEGIAILRVGGSTEGEMYERRDRVDDALCAARSAKKSGIQPGGGAALLQAAKRSSKNQTKQTLEMSDAAIAGYDVLIKACKAPVAQIVENTGEVPEIVLRKLLKATKENYGYDAKTNTFGNMIDKKIIDPHDVVASSLVHAASVASNILLIGCAISVTEHEGKETLGLLEEI